MSVTVPELTRAVAERAAVKKIAPVW